MKYDYHIIVIGGGSGGLVTAAGAASMGASVALLEGDKMGGDCLNYGCVPSKALIRSAHLAGDIGNSKTLGLDASLKKVNLETVMKRVKKVIKTIEPHDSEERFSGLGVDVIRERGILLDEHTVETKSKKITGKYIVIATGSGPAVPPIKGLKDVPYFTNETVFNNKKLPKHLLVLGGGPIGLELGQSFRHLGSDVTIIDFLPTLFGKDDKEVGPIMEDHFKKDGIKLELGSKIEEVKKQGNNILVVLDKSGKKKTVRGDQLLVSLGRVPSTNNLGLENAGVNVNDRGYVVVDKYLRTSVKNIFACGDVTGPYQFTHMAGYQAGIVLRNIISPFKSKVNYYNVAWSTYTSPEVAHVGYTEEEARSKKLLKDTVFLEINDNDRAITENDEIGFLKFIIGKKGKLIGATCVGKKAGELISLAAYAISQGAKATSFMYSIFPYPTEAEIFKTASLEIVKKSLKPWMKKLIKFLFIG